MKSNVGKSIFLGNIACNLASKGKTVLVISLEMSEMIYARRLSSNITRIPMKELKGFERIELEPGESKIVNFEIDNSLLEFYSYNNIWESEAGKFQLFIGTDSNVSDYKEFYLVD